MSFNVVYFLYCDIHDVYISVFCGRISHKSLCFFRFRSKSFVYEVAGLFDTNIEAAVARDELAMR